MTVEDGLSAPRLDLIGSRFAGPHIDIGNRYFRPF